MNKPSYHLLLRSTYDLLHLLDLLNLKEPKHTLDTYQFTVTHYGQLLVNQPTYNAMLKRGMQP